MHHTHTHSRHVSIFKIDVAPSCLVSYIFVPPFYSVEHVDISIDLSTYIQQCFFQNVLCINNIEAVFLIISFILSVPDKNFFYFIYNTLSHLITNKVIHIIIMLCYCCYIPVPKCHPAQRIPHTHTDSLSLLHTQIYIFKKKSINIYYIYNKIKFMIMFPSLGRFFFFLFCLHSIHGSSNKPNRKKEGDKYHMVVELYYVCVYTRRASRARTPIRPLICFGARPARASGAAGVPIKVALPHK